MTPPRMATHPAKFVRRVRDLHTKDIWKVNIVSTVTVWDLGLSSLQTVALAYMWVDDSPGQQTEDTGIVHIGVVLQDLAL